MQIKEILASCAVLQNGSYYLGCAYPNFKDPVVEKVRVLPKHRDQCMMLQKDQTNFCGVNRSASV